VPTIFFSSSCFLALITAVYRGYIVLIAQPIPGLHIAATVVRQPCDTPTRVRVSRLVTCVMSRGSQRGMLMARGPDVRPCRLA
jgi:hypothetical protein